MMQTKMFYKGLAARYYDAFFSIIDEEELSFYGQLIRSNQGPALEIASGTGRILLPLLERGHAVEGFDSSSEMLAFCRSNAAQKSLNPILYEQLMQTLQLPKQYGCLFSPLASFQQLAQLEDAYAALQKFYDHLLPNGQLMIYLYLPWYNAPEYGQWHDHDAVILQDGTRLQVSGKTIHDPIEQQLFLTYRYQLFNEGKILQEEERQMSIRWYSSHEFELMLKEVGFTHVSIKRGYADEGSMNMMLFLARK